MEPFNTKEIKEIFRIFRENGFKIYIVGGAVRDYLLGEPINDIDFTTDALPDEIESLFEKTYQTGKAFGTITISLNGKNFEITTFRNESNYYDGRHPGRVSFSTELTHDLSRRDFTINALVLDEKGEIKDFYGGLGDLKNKVIRTIGDPGERFREDQLRKWRVFRFAAQKKFSIESKTLESIIENPDTSLISIERIQDEFFKLLTSENPAWGGLLLSQTMLLTDLFDRIDLDLNDSKEIFELMDLLPNDLSLRLLVFFLETDPEKSDQALKNLKVSNSLRKNILDYLKVYTILTELKDENDLIRIKEALNLLGEDHFFKCLKLLKLKHKERLTLYEKLERKAKSIILNKEALSKKDLALNGSDLKTLGFSGKDIGTVLDWLLKKVYLNPKYNNKEILINLIKNEKTDITDCN